MYRQFNIQQSYVLPTQCIYVFCVDLRTNSDYFPIKHQRQRERIIIFRLLGALQKVINKNTLCVHCPSMKAFSSFYHEYEKANVIIIQQDATVIQFITFL